MRGALGDGYVEALRGSYPDVTNAADFVMYWWWAAASVVASGATQRAGLITTNSITQSSNRAVVSNALATGAEVVWVVGDHPWVDGAEGADVRVALTVIAPASGHGATWLRVDAEGRIAESRRVNRLNSDLSATADVAGAASVELVANAGLSFRGCTIVGGGFILDGDEAADLLRDAPLKDVVLPYINGRDLAQRPRGMWIIDFALRGKSEAASYARAFDIVRDRVRPERLGNGRKSYRDLWWRFAEPRPALRLARAGLDTIIVSPYVSKHRYFLSLRMRRPSLTTRCL